MAETLGQSELRGLLGETIPEGGTASETLVTEQQLQAWLTASNNDMNRAAYKGWVWKMAHWANLVNVTDGAAIRNLGDLMAHGETMVKMFARLTENPSRNRSRVGKISRP